MTTLDRIGSPAATTFVGRRRTQVLAGLTVATLLLALLASGPGPYAASHWHFTYEHGIISRALVGTIFQAVGGDPQTHVTVASIMVYAAAAAALVWGTVRLSDRSPMALLVAAVLLFGQTLPHLATMLGRFGGILVVLAVAAVAVASSRTRGRLAVATGLLVLSVLVHEAALLLTVAWVAAYVVHVETGRGNLRRGLRAGAAVAGPAVAVTTAIAAYTPPIAPAALRGRVFPPSVPDHAADAATKVHYWGAAEHILNTGRMAAEPWMVAYYVWVGLIPAAIVCTVVVLAFRRSAIGWSDLAVTERLMFAVSAAPLAMMLVGHDWDRWLMFSGLAVGATALVVLSRRSAPEPGRLWGLAAAPVAIGWALFA